MELLIGNRVCVTLHENTANNVTIGIHITQNQTTSITTTARINRKSVNAEQIFIFFILE